MTLNVREFFSYTAHKLLGYEEIISYTRLISHSVCMRHRQKGLRDTGEKRGSDFTQAAKWKKAT